MRFARDKGSRFALIKTVLLVGGASLLVAGCTTPTSVDIGNKTSPPPTLVPGGNTAHGLAIGDNTIADIAGEAMKSVVNIDTKTNVVVPGYGYANRAFDLFGEPQIVPRNSTMQVAGTGTGVIIRSDGYIMTNNHVVKQAGTITVTLNDKRVLTGKVIGRDKFSDLALVKIPANNLPVARLGTAKNLRPGEFAVAIGSPAGLSNTVTMGIISAIGRTLGELGEVGLIQTDTAINPGNSGGPLLNIKGEVIGINTAIRKDYQNIGFAIPIDNAKEIAQQILSRGAVEHPYLGIAMQDLHGQLTNALGLPDGTTGVVVAQVNPGSPAAAAGLQMGDVITKVGDKPVSSAKDVQNVVRTLKPGVTLPLQVLRAGQAVTMDVTIGDYPDMESK